VRQLPAGRLRESDTVRIADQVGRSPVRAAHLGMATPQAAQAACRRGQNGSGTLLPLPPRATTDHRIASSIASGGPAGQAARHPDRPARAAPRDAVRRVTSRWATALRPSRCGPHLHRDSEPRGPPTSVPGFLEQRRGARGAPRSAPVRAPPAQSGSKTPAFASAPLIWQPGLDMPGEQIVGHCGAPTPEARRSRNETERCAGWLRSTASLLQWELRPSPGRRRREMRARDVTLVRPPHSCLVENLCSQTPVATFRAVPPLPPGRLLMAQARPGRPPPGCYDRSTQQHRGAKVSLHA
jgi:hypothetical protein